MPFERDPLSVRYDAMAGGLLGRGMAQPGRWVYRSLPRPRPGPRTRRWLADRDITLSAIDEGGLTRYERAFTRALYYVHNGGANGRRNTVWSLQVRWGPPVPSGRLIGIRMSPPGQAQAANQRNPRGSWVRHERLQSGGMGSTKARFQ
jgi:hypothetical protein